jgi:probable blue pigment (indigoidine) exporter
LAENRSLLFCTTLFAWGAVFHVTAIGARHASPVVFSAFRTALPLATLLLLLKLGRLTLPPRRYALAIAGSGLLMVSFFSFGSVDGVARAGAGDAAVLANSPPLWVALISWFAFGERLSRRSLAGLLIGFAGLVVMFSSELHVAGGNVFVGMAISLAAGVGYAIATLTVKLIADREEALDPLGVLALQYLAGSPVLFAAAFATSGTAGTSWSSATFWFTALLVGLLSVVGQTAFLTSLKRLSATHTSVVVFLVPVVALAIELLSGQMPDSLTFLGMAVALCGVGLVSAGGARSDRRARLRPLPLPAPAPRAPGGSAGALVHAAVAPEPVTLRRDGR